MVPPAGSDGRDDQLRRLQRLTNQHALRTVVSFGGATARVLVLVPQREFRCPASAPGPLAAVEVHLLSSAGLSDAVRLECGPTVRVPMAALGGTGARSSRAALAALVKDVAAVAEGAAFPLPMGAGAARLLSWTASQSRFDVTLDVRGQPQRMVPGLLRGSLHALRKCLTRGSAADDDGDRLCGAFVVRLGAVGGAFHRAVVWEAKTQTT